MRREGDRLKSPPTRRAMAVGGLLAPWLAPNASARAAPTAPPAPDFAAIERASGGKLGVSVVDLKRGRTIGWRQDDRFPFCSSFKALLAAMVLWKAERGQLPLDRLVRYGPTDLHGLDYTPITGRHLAEGAMSVRDLCAAAMEYSDNGAANLLLRQVGGPKALTGWMRGTAGDPTFDLSQSEPLLNLSHFGDTIDTTSPIAMADSFRVLAFGLVLNPQSQKQWINWLLANTTGAKRLRAGLPADWRVGDRTGTMDGAWFSTIDVAIAWPPHRRPLVIAGFVTGHPSTQAGEAALAEVGRAVAAWVEAGG